MFTKSSQLTGATISSAKPKKSGINKSFIKRFKILAGILVVAGLAASYFMIFSKELEKIQSKLSESSDIGQQITAKQSEHKKMQKEIEDFANIEKQSMEVLEKILPSGYNTLSMFLQIQDFTQKVGLEFRGVSIDDNSTSDLTGAPLASRIKKLSINLDVAGPSGYAGVRELIRKIEKDIRFFNITSVSIEAEQPADAYNTEEAVEKEDLQEYSLSLETYYLE